MIEKHPLECLVDCNSKVLILGSFPSVISRKRNFYYANPNNRFWQVMSSIYNEDIINQKDFMYKHHIALWDVIASCELIGSSDASIKNVVCNDIRRIINDYPIEMIVLNGKKASFYYYKYFSDIKINIVECSSTSSANASKKLDDLIKEYKIIKDITNEKD